MFSDYERSAVRLAALMEIPNLYVWTHDSVAVGEDGPTHQPVEHLASFRAIPQLEVIRPADAFETAEAYRYFFEKKNTLPGAMVLTRQRPGARRDRRQGQGRRAQALTSWSTPRAPPDVILMASGSEVQWAVDAAKTLAGEGVKARVVSMPSMEWFEEQDAEYKEAVLPASVKARVSVEAGVAMPWYKYLGSYGKPRLHRTVRSAGRWRAEHDRPRHHRRARVEAAKRPSRKPKPPSDPSGAARRGEYASGGSLPVGTADKPLAGGVPLKICSITESKEKTI